MRESQGLPTEHRLDPVALEKRCNQLRLHFTLRAPDYDEIHVPPRLFEGLRELFDQTYVAFLTTLDTLDILYTAFRTKRHLGLLD